MNAGLSNLAKLKAAVLPPTLRGNRTDFDGDLVRHGLSVAQMIEGYCGRKLAYEAAAVQAFEAGNVVYSLERYPLVGIASVELQAGYEAAWQDVSDRLAKVDNASGILLFRSPPATALDTLQVEYAGGYWWDITEDDTGSKPAGATELPMALFNALALQVQAIIQATDLLGTGAAPSSLGDKPEKKPLPQVELLTGVKQILNPYRRFAA